MKEVELGPCWPLVLPLDKGKERVYSGLCFSLKAVQEYRQKSRDGKDCLKEE